jgi:siroheme synthase-like protein
MLERHAFVLVFAATDVEEVNAQVARDAAARGILCCRCDGKGGDFSGMATARVGGITVGVSTASGSPAVAAAVRDRVAASVDPAWGMLAELMAGWRVRARAVADAGARRALLQRAGSAEMVEAVRRGEGETLFAAWLAAAEGGGGQAGGRAGSDVQ